MRRVSYSAVFLAVALTACASGGGSEGSSSGGNRNLISADELAGSSAQSAYDAVQLLRPAWLRPRGGASPATIMDGRPQGDDVEGLRNIPIANVVSIRYLSPADATTSFGTGYTNGAIEVRTR